MLYRNVFWPAEWGDKFSKPMVELVFALFGYPEAGNIWENHAFSRLRKLGGKDALEFPSVSKHTDGSILTCYVDDFELQATLEATPKHWEQIGSVIDLSDPQESEAIRRKTRRNRTHHERSMLNVPSHTSAAAIAQSEPSETTEVF